MTDTANPRCAAFDAQLSDYLEHTLPAAARAEADAHLATCARCRALTDDLRAIVSEAAALGPIEPPRDLWAGIAARIEAPVVPIGRSGEHAAAQVTHLRLHDAASRRLLVSRRWLAAAASVLVVASVGATVAVMRATQGTQTNAPVVASTASAPASSNVPNAAESNTAPNVSPTAAPSVRAASNDADATNSATATYDREIASLRLALARRTDLDPSTAAVLRQNLQIIDDAVAACRRALARDPGSRLLGDQLTRTLDQQVELLRTAVLLPARS